MLGVIDTGPEAMKNTNRPTGSEPGWDGPRVGQCRVAPWGCFGQEAAGCEMGFPCGWVFHQAGQVNLHSNCSVLGSVWLILLAFLAIAPISG